MNILLLCWRDTAHPQGGGSERYLEKVGEYLAAQGHKVTYRTAAYTDSLPVSKRRGMVYHRRGGKFSVYIRSAIALSLARIGLGPYRKVDVVIDTQNGIPFFAQYFSKKPTILLTHHCHKEQWPVAGPILARLGWFLESQLSPWLHRRTQYVTVSGPSAEELVALGVDAERITIIRNGTDPIPDFTPLKPTDQLHAVTLSRLVPHKQIEHAMDVVAAVPELVLDVIGSGWWDDRLHAYAEDLGVTDRVVFHGQVSEEYKHALLDRAVLHLMPSRKEGWGLAVIEAAQHHVPTIGYASSAGLRDSIHQHETGVLVDSKAQLISATRQLLADPAERKRLGDNAAEHAKNFSWQQTGEAFEELVQQVKSTGR